MTDRVNLHHLEAQIDNLLHAYQQVVDENRTLREQKATLASEKAKLLEKNNLARSRIEAMIARLKSMETHL